MSLSAIIPGDSVISLGLESVSGLLALLMIRCLSGVVTCWRAVPLRRSLLV